MQTHRRSLVALLAVAACAAVALVYDVSPVSLATGFAMAVMASAVLYAMPTLRWLRKERLVRFGDALDAFLHRFNDAVRHVLRLIAAVGGRLKQSYRTAPGHSWRMCAST